MLRPQPRSTLFPYTTLFRSETEDIVDAVFSEVSESHLPELRKDVTSSVLKETQDGIQAAVTEAIDQRTKELRKEIVGRIRDRKSTRLNSSHQIISYAVFCLK